MLLSIIIPVYNTPINYIQECLDSLSNIHLSKELYEIILVNDGSTDVQVINYLDSMSSFPLTILHKENGGLSAARNYGISNAKGKYIYPLDSDDKISLEFSFFTDILINDDIDVLYGDFYVFGDKNYKISCPQFSRLRLFYDQNMLPACSFYKKSIWANVGGYDENFETMEDWDFWVRCLLQDSKFRQIKKCAYHYRIVNDGASLVQKTKHLKVEHLKKMRNKIPALNLTKEEMDLFAWEYVFGWENEGNLIAKLDEHLSLKWKDRKLQKMLLKHRIKYYKNRWYRLPELLVKILVSSFKSNK